MSYRNKTYVAFDADNDIRYYRIMQAWKANDGIDFDFHDAHDLNNLWKKSNEETIKRKLRERMVNSKQVVVLVGDHTKDLYKFVRWEIELAIDMELPIIAANLNKANGATTNTPPILNNNAYFVSVPFGMREIRYALDNFPSEYYRNKNNAPSQRHYDWSKVAT